MRVLVDLHDVERFDVTAPLVTIQTIAPVARLIESVDIIVRNLALRTAAISAAHVLGLPFQVHARREPR